MEYCDRCEICNDDLESFEDVHDRRDEVMSPIMFDIIIGSIA